jgi:phospholipid transport system transporter-binding protein
MTADNEATTLPVTDNQEGFPSTQQMLALSSTAHIRRPTMVLPTEVTHTEATGCLRMLLAGVRAAKNDKATTVIVDASQLTLFDSSALAVLLECRRVVLYFGQRFVMRGAPVRLAELAYLYGVGELLGIERVN